MSQLFVPPQWLQTHLGDPRVRVVDGSWYLPAQNRDTRAEFLAGHIPGAVFFDIDRIADRATSLPHMLPSTEEFGEAAGALGLSETDTIVVYDGAGLFAAPRVWWTFRVFGADDVRILEGGLPAWKAAGLPLETGEAEPQRRSYRGALRAEAVRSAAEVLSELQAGASAVVDARPEARFRGEAPEPRHGLRSGHMPGALNLPGDRVIEAGGRLAPPERIRELFNEAGLDLSRPVTATCGSGVTAATLVLALATLGKQDVALYDGSWAEWGGRDDLPLATGRQ